MLLIVWSKVSTLTEFWNFGKWNWSSQKFTTEARYASTTVAHTFNDAIKNLTFDKDASMIHNCVQQLRLWVTACSIVCASTRQSRRFEFKVFLWFVRHSILNCSSEPHLKQALYPRQSSLFLLQCLQGSWLLLISIAFLGSFDRLRYCSMCCRFVFQVLFVWKRRDIPPMVSTLLEQESCVL